ncbi:DUF3231 family protein [Halobacillus shinanisalinarum]|uniref:DUF3231 family protein n=1 Tax=Halobacillus shinanisalinarum TaxID=2932258 RepID=A0ABY4GWS7_9BACI|nr:DUF3231 family protein [Halobacillus shinanisalinarum]UOQ92499.1 DUF3231 family protein [Halobacillus shinanisalinarum]
MKSVHHPKLTSAEVSNLWTTFHASTMIKCGLTYFLATVEDPDIQSVLEYTLEFTEKRIQTITRIFQEEKYPVPVGFTDDDVNKEAPRLFSDALILLYMLNMGRLSLTGESILYGVSARDDIAAFYYQCLEEMKELTNRARKVALDKGVLLRYPYLPTPQRVDFVKDQSFLTGWLGERRPLLGIEITNLVFNAERNALGEAVIIGFSQAVESKEIAKYMKRGKQISAKHFKVFSSVLHEENLSSAKNLTSEVTDSTVPPFSDKLMMFHISGLVASGIAQYGTTMSTSPRRDLGLLYARLTSEIAMYSEDGANIMINKGWMEQPPQAADRGELVKKK